MSIESAKAFIEKVRTDEEFAKSVEGASSREERLKIAKAAGFTFTPEDLMSVTHELPIEELESVAGGSWCGHTHETEGGCKAYWLIASGE